MKYVLLFCGTREQQQAWENMSEEARNAQYAQVGRWFAENAAKLGPGNQLQSPHNHPFCSAMRAASMRFCAPSFCMAVER